MTNTATGSTTFAGDPVVSNSDFVTINAIQTPQITLTKNADIDDQVYDTLNETLNYTYSVENTGNVTLTAPVVSDNNVDAPPVLHRWRR